MAMPDELGIYSGAITVLEGRMRRSFVFSISFLVVLGFTLLLYSPLALTQSVSPIPPDAQAAMGELQKEPFRAHMAFLADDLLAG